jgi:dihydrofolate synthase/folylpolyglutamate synthase
MTYDEAIAFWFGRVNYELAPPEPADLKLDRMRELLHRLGDPQDRLRIVHVAGSKGKGSTSAFLAAVLRAAGYRTGLFTSPHLCRVEERIQVDGECIAREELAARMARIAAVLHENNGGELSPTFFEVGTALGFLHFAERQVEAAVVEVGLGGRFDSTNVCLPLVSVITSISLDHTQQLGSRLADIAMEKAGIVKPGRPVVSGVTQGEPRDVIEAICRERGAPLSQLGVDFTHEYEPGRVEREGIRRPRVRVRTRQRAWPPMELGLLGRHQGDNAALVVACVELLRDRGFSIPDGAVVEGLAGVQWPARFEVIGRRPTVVVDCAHNVASAEALVETLQSMFAERARRLIFAASGDKDLVGILKVLAPHFRHAYLTRYGSSRRGATTETLADILRADERLPFTTHATPEAAWHAARADASPEEVICVAGSVFLAGELRPLIVDAG